MSKFSLIRYSLLHVPPEIWGCWLLSMCIWDLIDSATFDILRSAIRSSPVIVENKGFRSVVGF